MKEQFSNPIKKAAGIYRTPYKKNRNSGNGIPCLFFLSINKIKVMKIKFKTGRKWRQWNLKSVVFKV
jgi:hypothetical protein